MIYGKYKVWIEHEEEAAKFYEIDSPKHAAAAFLDERRVLRADVIVLDKVSQVKWYFMYRAPDTYGALKEIDRLGEITQALAFYQNKVKDAPVDKVAFWQRLVDAEKKDLDTWVSNEGTFHER